MRKKYLNLIYIILFGLASFSSYLAQGQNKIKFEEFPDLAKKMKDAVPEGKALFVFEAKEDFQFDSDNENIVQPIKEGLLYKLYISVETSSGAVTIMNIVADKATINYGRNLFENSLPAIKKGEIRYFKLSLEPMILKPKLEWSDVTRAKKMEGAADLPTFNIEDALIIFNVVPKDLEIKIEGKKIDTVINDVNGVYKVYIQPEDQVLVISSSKYMDESVPVGNINTKDVRYYYVQTPPSDEGLESFDPSIKVGNYLIESIPAGALIQITGNPYFNNNRFKTPYPLESKEGTDIITLTLDRYETITDTIIISNTRRKNRSKYTLTPNFAFINCNIEPAIPISKILMDGVELTSIVNEKDFECLKGTHNIEISAPHYYSETRQISLAAAKISEINVKLKPKMGSLSILSGINASGAEVLINGNKVGNIPISNLALQEGSYEVRFKRSDFISEKSVYTIEVLESKLTNFRDLKMINTRKVHITTSPVSGATVYIDKDNIPLSDKTNLYVTLGIGDHSIKVEREHYKPYSKNFTVDQENEEFNFELEELSYTVSFYSKPSNSNVIIDGVLRGRTPIDLQLPLGSHKVKFEQDKYFNKNKTIYVSATSSLEMKQFNKSRTLLWGLVIVSGIITPLIPAN